MAPSPEYDQQLEWSVLLGGGSMWNANAQVFRPIADYTAKQMGLMLCRIDNNRRGPGLIKLERVTDLTLEGETLTQETWHSDELGPPGVPQWLSRNIGEVELNKDQNYRIVVHTTPGWEVWDEDKGIWKLEETAAGLQFAVQSEEDLYPRGYEQYGYNYWNRYLDELFALGYSESYVNRYLDAPPPRWKSLPDSDLVFMVGPTPLVLYTLSIYVVPTGAGMVDWSPRKGAYQPGDVVNMLAIAAEGYKFTMWQGSISSLQNPETVTMDSDKEIVATFEETTDTGIPIIDSIVDWIKAMFEELKAWLLGRLQWVVDQVKAAIFAIISPLIAPIKAVVDWIQGKLLEVWSWVKEVYSWTQDLWQNFTTKVSEAISSWFAERWASLSSRILELWRWVKEVYSWTRDLWQNFTTKVTEAISSWFTERWAWLTEKVSEAWSWLKDIRENFTAMVKEAINAILEEYADVIDELKAFFADPGAWVVDKIVTPMVDEFNRGLERALAE